MKRFFLFLFAAGLLSTGFSSCRDNRDVGDDIQDVADDIGDQFD